MVQALLLAAALAGAPDGAEPRSTGRVVEEVVAVVRNPAGAAPRAITLTKLVEEARIALVGRGAVEAAFRPLDAEALRAALDWLVDQTLVADEAARLRGDDVPRDDVVAEVRRFRARFPSEDGYRRFLAANALTDEELGVVLARSIRVQRYLESRVGRAVRVDDEEVDRYLRERGATLRAPAAREAVRAQLAEQHLAAHVKELLAELRSRAEIRVLDPAPGGA